MAAKGKTRERQGAGFLDQARIILLVAVGAFVLVSLTTYAPVGSGRGNLCGRAGRSIAEPLLAWLGFSAFVLFGLVVFWGGAVLFGKKLERPLLKALGIVMLTLSVGAFLSMVLAAGPYRGGGLFGPGGIAGAGLAYRLRLVSGEVGAFIFATVGILVGLTLATEWLLLAIARDLGVAGRRLVLSLGQAIRGIRPAIPILRATGAGLVKEPAIEEPVEEEPSPGVKARRNAEDRKRREQERKARRRIDDMPGSAKPRAESPRSVKPGPGTPQKKAPAKRAASRPEATGKPYAFPPLDLLDRVKPRDPRHQEAMIEENAQILEETLSEFRVEAEVVDHRRGPVVTLFELDLAAGIKVNRIHNLSEDLAVALKSSAVRVVAPLPGKSTIGVEVPNPVRDDVRLQSLVSSEVFERNPGFLPMFLGTDVAGNPLIEDLTTMPHLLIAGATGSGKSICINSILLSLLLTRSPDKVRLILIDPKHVELAFFAKVPHLMSPVVTDMKKALVVLEWLVREMEQRYAIFHSMEVRNIHSYNELGPKAIRERKIELGIPVDEEVEEGKEPVYPDHMPYVVIVVDELADLMMVAGKEIEHLITRLAQKSRAVGIHIVLATQRPSTDVITGLIKANMPTRISFQVASKIDSRVVLDQNGAEKLLGRGDMLYLPPRSSHLVRAQGTFVSDGEVKRAVKFLAERVEQRFNCGLRLAQSGEMLRDDEKDSLYEDAIQVILSQQRGSASLLQRALGVGYTRGSRLLDHMHKEGLVGPYRGSKAREVLTTLEEYEESSRARMETS